MGMNIEQPLKVIGEVLDIRQWLSVRLCNQAEAALAAARVPDTTVSWAHVKIRGPKTVRPMHDGRSLQQTHPDHWCQY